MHFAAENVHSRSSARAVALVRGWGNTELTARCLASLRRDCSADELRIVYVDNGTPVAEFADLAQRFPDVEMVRFPSNLGSCRGINTGLLLAALEPHEFVLLMDNDTEVPAGDKRWLERWISCFDDPAVGAAGAVSDYVSGQQQIEQTPETYMRAWEHDGRCGVKGLPQVPVLVSFAIMFRRQALESIGWLSDERFEPGNSEDYDLCLRLTEQNWKSVVAQSVWIHHRGSQTFRRFPMKNLLTTNLNKLVAKYGVDRMRVLGLEIAHA